MPEIVSRKPAQLVSPTEQRQLLVSGGFDNPEDVRQFYRGNEARLALVVKIMRAGGCPCCGALPEETEIVRLECGHTMCTELCEEYSHECIPCALAT